MKRNLNNRMGSPVERLIGDRTQAGGMVVLFGNKSQFRNMAIVHAIERFFSRLREQKLNGGIVILDHIDRLNRNALIHGFIR